MLLYGPDALPATQPIVLNQGKSDEIMLLVTYTRDVNQGSKNRNSLQI